MTKSFKSLVLLAIVSCLSMILASCATVGRSFTFSGPSEIVAGKTSKGDLVSSFGLPFRVGFDNGNEKWAYGWYHYSIFGSSSTKNLDVIFDKNGLVSSYSYESSDPVEVKKALPPGEGK
jgi:hypothetical protein